MTIRMLMNRKVTKLSNGLLYDFSCTMWIAKLPRLILPSAATQAVLKIYTILPVDMKA